MPAHPFHYLYAHLYRSTQVFRTLYLIALKEVIGTYLYFKQPLAQLQLGFQSSINPVQQDGLIVHRHAGTKQAVNGPSRFRSYLIRVIEVGVQPDRPVFREHVTKFFVNTLRQYNRETGTDKN